MIFCSAVNVGTICPRGWSLRAKLLAVTTPSIIICCTVIFSPLGIEDYVLDYDKSRAYAS